MRSSRRVTRRCGGRRQAEAPAAVVGRDAPLDALLGGRRHPRPPVCSPAWPPCSGRSSPVNHLRSFWKSFALVLFVAATPAGCGDADGQPLPAPIAGGNSGSGQGAGGAAGTGAGQAGGAPGGAGGSGGGSADAGPAGAPPAARRTLAFRMTPVDAVMKAAFELLVEIRDPDRSGRRRRQRHHRHAGARVRQRPAQRDPHPHRGRRRRPLRGPRIRPVGERHD